jgi:hypothetical protein
LNGGKLYFYLAGTTTPATVYTSSAMTTAHAHPVLATTAGLFPAIWLSASVTYDVTCKNSANAVQWTVLNYSDALTAAEVGPALTADWIGQAFYPISAAETGAGLVDADLTHQYIYGDVRRYGAVGDGVTNDTTAFQHLAAVINASGGGVGTIPEATYIVGRQSITGSIGQNNSYVAEPILRIQGCTKPVLISGYGAKIKIASGMKLGAFDPVSGVAVAQTADQDYRADISWGIIDLYYNTGRVTVEGLELDGNISGIILGGRMPDASGWQCSAYGVRVYNTPSTFRDINSHHHGLDGFALGWEGEADTSATGQRFSLSNCSATYNARQGLSWVGGNGLTAINCQFSNTGKSTFASQPGAGVDIEAESAVIRRGTFINCEMINNEAGGIVADSGDSADVTVIGCSLHSATQYSVWCTKPRFKFIDCEFGGTALGNYTATEEINRTLFLNCSFSTEFTHGYAIYGTAVVSAAGNPIYDGCDFYTTNAAVNLGDISTTSIIRNCTFKQNGSVAAATVRGIHEGSCTYTLTTGSNDMTGYSNRGRVFFTGTLAGVPAVGGELPTTTGPALTVRGYGDNGTATPQVNSMSWSYQAPVAGDYIEGDIVWNATAAVGQPRGWMCSVSGTPGIWVSLGNL